MKVTFCGAAKVVTGSCFLIETENVKFLVDCGQFQGDVKLEELNYSFPFDPSEIDFVILTHGHLDHCGKLPLLKNKGFRRRIYATSGTIDIARLILMDAAKVQEESLPALNRRRLREGLPPVKPLFLLDDAVDVFKNFKSVEKGKWYSIKDVKFRFHDAGHILCSSFVEVQIEGKTLIFSGDIGNPGKPIVPDPEIPPKADIIFIESTYGDRLHKSLKESVKELKEAINDTFQRGGIVLIPTFVLERAQDILYYLRQFLENGEIPSCKVFLDSPLAISITKVFKRHRECYDEEALSTPIDSLFSFPGLDFTKTVNESKKINEVKEKAIIIAGNGMCTGGRILHHLRHRLWEKRNSIIFIGYQAEGTLGREIIEGKKKVKVFNEIIKVSAKVYTINGFSSHGDRDELLNWLGKSLKGDSKVVLIHGEEEQMTKFRKYIKKNLKVKDVLIPSLFDTLTF